MSTNKINSLIDSSFSERDFLSVIQQEIGNLSALATFICENLQPELNFSDCLMVDDFLLPLQKLQFPQKNQKEFHWILNETLTAMDKIVPQNPVFAVYLASMAIAMELGNGPMMLPTAPHAAGILVLAGAQCQQSLQVELFRFLTWCGRRYQQDSSKFDSESSAVCFLAAGVLFYRFAADYSEMLWRQGAQAFQHHLLDHPELISRKPWSLAANSLEEASLKYQLCAEEYLEKFKP